MEFTTCLFSISWFAGRKLYMMVALLQSLLSIHSNLLMGQLYDKKHFCLFVCGVFVICSFCPFLHISPSLFQRQKVSFSFLFKWIYCHRAIRCLTHFNSANLTFLVRTWCPPAKKDRVYSHLLKVFTFARTVPITYRCFWIGGILHLPAYSSSSFVHHTRAVLIIPLLISVAAYPSANEGSCPQAPPPSSTIIWCPTCTKGKVYSV